MPAFITSRPEKTVSSNISRWSAVTNPVIFTVERQDLNIIGVTDSGGLVQVEIINAADLVPFGTAVGDKVYLKSGNYDGVGTIQAATSTVTFTLDIPFVANASGGIINLPTNRTNYRLQVRIMRVINNVYQTLVTTGQFRTNEKGIANIDIRSWLQTVPKMINDFQYDVRNQADPNLGGNYIFQIRELYTDPSGDFEGAFADPAFGNLNYFVNAARQIQDEHGGNMAQFVPFFTNVDESEKALFLSGFTEPSRFAGYPFDLQFIYSDLIALLLVTKEERSYDINDSLKDTNSDVIEQGHNTTVNRLTLEESYDSDASNVDVWLTINDNAIAAGEYSESEYVDEEYDSGEFPEDPNTPIAIPR